MNRKTERLLKVDKAGRVWTPRELREAALDEFGRVGMAATQSAGQIGVKYPTFASWVQKGRREHGGRKRSPWVEVDAPRAAISTALSVHLPGGARIEVADSSQAHIAAELLRVLAVAESRGGTRDGLIIPAHPPLTILELERRRSPDRQRHPLPLAQHHLAQEIAHRRQRAQIMFLREQRIKSPELGGRDDLDLQ